MKVQLARRTTQPIAIATATELRQKCPALTDQHEYSRRVAALRAYQKTPAFAVAEIESQAAMAQTVDEMRARGELAKQGDNRHAPRPVTLTGLLKVSEHAAECGYRQWAKVAAIPEPVRLTYYASVTGLPSRAGLLQHVSTSAKLPALPDGSFRCIYADPPWQYGNQKTRAATSNHYTTMTTDEIAALPVSEMADDNAHLHLWTTNAFLFDAKHVMEAWGFTYKSVFVWVKPQMGIGNYWRVSHEFMLFGIRGTLPFADRGQKSWLEADRQKHSQKPEAVRAIIEKVSPGPYLELFARTTCPGWEAWGNEVERTLQDAISF